MKEQIALLTGGNTSERDVALKSAQNILSALEVNYDVTVFDFPKDLKSFVHQHDVYVAAVPVFHGRGGEDGAIQGFLDTFEVPYLFSGVTAHAAGMDKVMTKQLAEGIGIKTPAWEVLEKGRAHNWQEPIVVKPIDEGSSVGVELVLESRIVEAKETTLLIEQFVKGREYTVAVIDSEHGIQALPVIEIRSKNSFFDFESKYDSNLCDELCPAPIDIELTGRLQDVALQVHKLIGAKHLSRSDMIVDDDGNIWFLEVNTIPGMTNESLTPKSIRVAGLCLDELLAYWIETIKRKTA